MDTSKSMWKWVNSTETCSQNLPYSWRRDKEALLPECRGRQHKWRAVLKNEDLDESHQLEKYGRIEKMDGTKDRTSSNNNVEPTAMVIDDNKISPILLEMAKKMSKNGGMKARLEVSITMLEYNTHQTIGKGSKWLMNWREKYRYLVYAENAGTLVTLRSRKL